MQKAPNVSMTDVLNATAQSQSSLEGLFGAVKDFGKEDRLNTLFESGKLDGLNEFETRKLIASQDMTGAKDFDQNRLKDLFGMTAKQDVRNQQDLNREDIQSQANQFQQQGLTNKLIDSENDRLNSVEKLGIESKQKNIDLQGKKDLSLQNAENSKSIATHKENLREKKFMNVDGNLWDNQNEKWVKPPMNTDGQPMTSTKAGKNGKGKDWFIGGKRYNKDAVETFYNMDPVARANMEREVRNGAAISYQVIPEKRSNKGKVYQKASGVFFDKLTGTRYVVSSKTPEQQLFGKTKSSKL